MKIKISMFLAAVISTSALADDAVSTNVPQATPVTAAPEVQTQTQPMLDAPATNAPAAKPARHRAPSRKPRKRAPMAELRSVPLVPGPAVVAVSPTSHVNVRGQPRLKSEIVARMTNGEPVTVIEEIHLKHSGAEEPSAWAKIGLPEAAHTWVHTSFINQANMTVIPKKLNFRSGPGQNYSVLGTLKAGDTVSQIETKGQWMQITPPHDSYAFMAAQYLTQSSAALASASPNTMEEPAITSSTVVAENPTVATNITTASTAPETTDTNLTSTEPLNELTSTNESSSTTPVVEAPQPRIVVREGVVRGTFSIQAPTPFELVNMEDHRTINYLFTSSTNLDLSRYKGLHIMVTGEEGLDERWKNTPVLTIQRIQVLD